MTSEQWKKDIAYAMTPFKQLTWVNGVWPLQDYNIFSLIRFYFATFCMITCAVLPFIELQMGCTDAEENVDSLMFICCGVVSTVKTICFRIYANNLIDTYSAAVDDYQTIDNLGQRKIMRRFAFIGRTLACFMVCFAYFACAVYTLIPLLGDEPINQLNVTDENNVELDYTIPSRCTLEYFHAPTSMYKIITLTESFIMALTCTCNHGNDAMFLNIALHMCGQIKILKANFTNIDVVSPQVYSNFNALIRRHSNLMRLCKKLAETISFVLLTQLFITSILLCIMGFQFILALKKNDAVMLAKSCVVLASFLTQISVYSFVGDYFKCQMEEIALFLYQSTWYDLPAKLTRNLTFIIMRAQSPIKLQAGNFIVIIVVILPFIELQTGCTDAEENVDCLMIICCGLISAVKNIYFRIYANNLIDTYSAAVDDYRTIDNPGQRKIMRRFAFIGRTLACFMVCFAYFACAVYTLIPLLDDKPINQLNVTDENNVELDYTIPSRCTLEYFHIPSSMYKIINFIESFMMTLTSTCNHGNDAMFLNIVLHMCGQIKILKANFTNIDVVSPQVYSNFNALIRRHSYLIMLCKKLAETISFVLLTQLFITSILLCIMGFQFILALKKNDAVMLAKSCVVLGSFLTQISVYSFIGDYFKCQMEEVALFLYQSTWYDLPAKLKKNLTFLIMRAQFPIKLQAANFIVINLETYMSILKTSISYLSVLRVMVDT
ncbi:uncharacterized protein LOC116848264 [Odontomachus brunneus]|uniref:uncharacterized protein LOC116848264 n=1 Tax=Odontomachus brunneus TaxID=486640 RepID=UPI0013F1ECBC|nr:uncharacterized protein LOC116848264 [Odontomachus brunneus]